MRILRFQNANKSFLVSIKTDLEYDASVVTGRFQILEITGLSDAVISRGLRVRELTYTIDDMKTLASDNHVALIYVNADQSETTVVAAGATLAYSSSSMGAGTNGAPYTGSVTFVGGSGKYKNWIYSISAGTLPTGLSLNTATGAVTGTPTANATYVFTIQVSDGFATATHAFSVVVS